MNCRDFLNEFEERNALSSAATLHLNDCADCRKTNVMQTRVWQAIDGFAPVDAPNDFNFRVKARIANAEPNDFQPRFFPVLRYVLPLSAVGLILAFVVFNGIFSIDDKTVSPIAENKFQTLDKKENLAASSSTVEQVTDDSQSPKIEQSIAGNPNTPTFENKKELKMPQDKPRFVAAKFAKKPQVKTPGNSRENSGGSQLNAVSQPRILTPKGLNPTQKIETPSNFEKINPMTAGQILSELGIETVLENGKWEVKSVKQNSVGERSRVKVGDLIEAIDGEKLTGEPKRAKTIEGKKLTVLRGAEKIEISLRN